jgi:arylsulfatase A-like enzyme
MLTTLPERSWATPVLVCPHNRVHRLPALFLVLCFLVPSGCSDDELGASRSADLNRAGPNILVLLADDMGNNDLGISHNHPANVTPNMDRLARAGTRFTRFYTESTCSPSRAALLTGRYASRAGFRPAGRGIPPDVTTLPESLRDHGYATHHVGKWHLGTTVAAALPLAQGFDTSFGFLNQWSMRRPGPLGDISFPTYRNPWLTLNDGPRRPFRGHLTDLLADHTINLIEKADARKPWFIYHAFFAPHDPIEPAKRFSKQFPDTPAGRYRALLNQLDSTVGRILESLRNTGQFENTIVILASDNGATNESLNSNYPFYGKKATYWEGGVRVPLIIHWPEDFAPGTTFDEPVAIFDLYPTILEMASIRSVSSDFDGVSLVEAQRNRDILRRTLFWESVAFQRSVYGVLTPGRKRLLHELSGREHLLDLAEDPFGDPENAIEDAILTASIRDEYEHWRSETRRVETNWSPMGSRGHGVLTGDDFQRSPGMAGYTFAIGVTPSDAPTDSTDSTDSKSEVQIIAQQRNLLTISFVDDATISVDLDAQRLESKPIERLRCHSIVLSSYFYRNLSPLSAKKRRRPVLNLYLDGELVDLAASELNVPRNQDLSEPTHIGQGANGRNQFAGHLSPVQIYNQVLEKQKDVSFGGIEGIHDSVCPRESSSISP